MRGLGADTQPSLTPKQIELLSRGVLNVGGCVPQLQTNFNSMQCLTPQLMQWFGSCYVGTPPGDMTPLEFAAACLSIGKCGGFSKPGCPNPAVTEAALPPCANADLQSAIDYCGAHPNFDGPTGPMNAACWSMARYPDLYARLMATPRCVAAAPPPPAMPPPAMAPPPPDMTAPVQYDTTPVAPDATPVNVPDMVPTDSGAPPPQTASTSNMAMWGIAAVVAVGAGYFLLRKKK
jgi:LPXTG-motif cell wall-anchored protein